MGLGQLNDAAARERCRRLLGEDMVAAVRRASRAQLGALVDREQPSHLAAIKSEEVVGLQQVKQQSGRRLCPGPNVDGPLCSNNVVFESRRAHVKLTGVSLVHGGCQTHHLAVTTTCEETRAPETLMTAFNTSALRSSSAAAGTGKTMVEHTLLHRSHGMSDPAEQEDANASYSLLQVEQTHRRAATAPSEKTGWLETLIPGQHTAMVFQSSATAGKFSKVDSQESDSDGNDSMLMPIFVRHGSGELTFTVRMHESTNDLMQLYSERTKTTLDSQYFAYGRKKLEPHHTWLSCGLKRDTTVHVCTRLLGGANYENLEDYINNNKLKFVKVVSLPGGSASLQMTILGCRFLSSWINCFTRAFSAGRSWNGEFELVDFIFAEDHVRSTSKKKPWKYTNKPGAAGADIIKFADKVGNSILLFSDMQNIVSKNRPPYVQACMNILRGLVGSGVTGPLTAVSGPFPKEYKLLLDTLVCCMTSYARERLIIELFRKYEGADENERSLWDSAIKGATCPSTWRTDLCNSAIFNYFIQRRNSASNPYPNDRTGAFTLLRDVVMHAADYNENANTPQAGDGIELTIPDTLENFLPTIIKNLIENNIDISAELSAAISCACNICDASH